jgi:hypothetical protein
LLEKSDPKAAARAFGLGLASDPLAEEVACRGRFSIGAKLDEPAFLSEPARATSFTQFSNWAALCEAARKLPRD